MHLIQVAFLLFQLVILALILKRARIKALVKDKRSTEEAFGTYVEVKLLCTDYSNVFEYSICFSDILMCYFTFRGEIIYIRTNPCIFCNTLFYDYNEYHGNNHLLIL